MKKSWFFLFLLLLSDSSYGQNSIIDSLRISVKEAPNDTIKIDRLNELGWQLHYNFPDSADNYIMEALTLSRKMGYQRGIAFAYVNLGSNEITRNNFKEARRYYLLALEVARQSKDYSRIATYLVNVGYTYIFESNYDSAFVYIFEGVEVVEENGLENEVYSGFNALAKVYNFMGRYEDAVIQYRKALEVLKKIGKSQGIAYGHSSLATGLVNADSLDAALHHFEKALKIGAVLQDSSFNAYCYGNTASIWEKKGDWAKAHEYSLRSEKAELFLTGKNAHPLANTYKNLAVSSMKLNMPHEAIEYARKSINLSKRIGNIEYITLALEKKAEAFAMLNQHDSAYYALKEFTDWNDSLRFESQTKSVSEMEAKYQVEKTKTEIANNELLISKQKRQFYQLLFIATLGLLFLGLGFLWYRNRQLFLKREANHQFQIQEQETQNLRELDQLKSRFFANISHEFRTPLTLILGPLNQLLSGKANSDPETLYLMMKRNGERLLQLINQLLDLSKLEAGKMKLNLVQSDIWGFLRLQAGNFESQAVSKNIRFHVKIPNRDLMLAFDRDKLEKTISNLLSNAFKFTPEDGDVWLTAETFDNLVEITIRDNGIGIPEDQLEHIFDRFYQVDGGEFEGTGIGLALTRELIELHKGKIYVSSELGKGSIFVVKIPLNLGNENDQLDDHSPIIAPTPSEINDLLPAVPSDKGQLQDLPSLLIVEDNPDVRMYLKSILEKNYKIKEATNGLEGLEMAQNHLPDLIISDIMMPRMDGLAFTEEIKTDLCTSHIPVILLTAKAGRESKLEGLQTGADDYLPKPFDEEELMIRVKNLLDQRKRMGMKFGKEIIRLSPEEIMVESADKKFLDRLIKIIESYMDNEAFSIEDMGREIGLSRSQLHRKVKALTDQSPSVFLRTIRLKRAKTLLEKKVGTASEIGFLVGFSSAAYFSKCFKDFYGISPGEISSNTN